MVKLHALAVHYIVNCILLQRQNSAITVLCVVVLGQHNVNEINFTIELCVT